MSKGQYLEVRERNGLVIPPVLRKLHVIQEDYRKI